jgi:hypothetical protein
MKLSDTELTMAERQMIENSLLRGEELLWTGKPVPRLWTPASIIMMLTGIVFLSFDCTIFFFVMGADIEMLLFAIPFIVVGSLLIASPWIGLGWQKRHMYALTNRRALVFRYMFWKHHQMAFPVDKVMLIDRKVPAAGLVSLVLGKSTMVRTNGVPDPEGFLNITAEDAAVVEPLIMQLEESQTK